MNLNFEDQEDASFFINPLLGYEKENKFFLIQEKPDFYLFQILKNLTTDDIKSFQDVIIYILQNPKNVIIDLFYAEKSYGKVNHLLKLLKFQLSSTTSKFFIINSQDTFKSTFLGESTDEEENKVFKNNLTEAIKSFSNDKAPLSLVKSIILGIQKTLIVQIGRLSFRKKTAFRLTEKEKFKGELQGIVEIESDEKSYLLVVSFNKNVYLPIVSGLLLEDFDEINEENQDAVAELINITLGIAKNILRGENKTLQYKIPFFLKNNNTRSVKFPGLELEKNLSKYTILSLPFLTDSGEFYVEIMFPPEYKNEDISSMLFR